MVWVTTEVDVDVELSEIDTEDLLQELEGRGIQARESVAEIIENLHTAYILDRKQTVETLLRDLFYHGLGRIV
jgi:hypothetical protein